MHLFLWAPNFLCNQTRWQEPWVGSSVVGGKDRKFIFLFCADFRQAGLVFLERINPVRTESFRETRAV
jgi:hypothetical protein